MAHAVWNVVPLTTPTVRRPCAGCHELADFACADAFRVNCNGARADVWLIYRCERCGNRWNAEILARAQVARIEPALYRRFLANDRELAWRYAFAAEQHSRWGTFPSRVRFAIERDEEGAAIRIACRFPRIARLDAVIAAGLEVPRAQVGRLARSGDLRVAGGPRALRRPVAGGEVIEFAASFENPRLRGPNGRS